MAESAYILEPAIQTSDVVIRPRHSTLVRITHWIFTLSFFGLMLSGLAITLAHPHFYWGEAGSMGTPSLFDLPLPTKRGGPSGWGRSLHFQSAWLAVLSGLLYVVSGIFSRHFYRRLIPAKNDLSWRSLRAVLLDHLRFRRPGDTGSYNLLQRLSYLAVVFLVFPLTIITGLAMSPALTSVLPQLVTVFGGQETARTLHFFLANLLVLFLVVHVVMVIRCGFKTRMLSMITGHTTASRKRAL